MGIIHMDVDSVRAARRDILNIRSRLYDLLSRLDSTMGEVVGVDWTAPSGDQFISRYSEIKRQTLEEINRLEEMAQKLNREIDRWEEISAKLGN